MKLLLRFALIPGLVAALNAPALAQSKPLSVQMADAFMGWFPDSIVVGNQKAARWDYEQGLMLYALQRVWQRTADPKYFSYITHNLDQFVRPDGSIRTFRTADFNLDNLTPGRVLLMLSQQQLANKEKYRKAADSLMQQLEKQPRTQAGGFWHKQQYPDQMWLDGLYMAEPFYAQYSQLYNRPQGFNDIARQFALAEQNLTDSRTGLLYHGYDESRRQRWADPKTGRSPSFWGRAMGWYAMALVDVLDFFPEKHPERPRLEGYLLRLMKALLPYQAADGTWFQVTDRPAQKGNYAEASASAMYVYALLKGIRMGYLPASMRPAALKGYDGLVQKFVQKTPGGGLAYTGTVSVGGLGGEPYRDGSYQYYLSEPLRSNDLKGVGPFVLASLEREMADELSLGQGRTVAVDTWFNHEYRKDAAGQPERFHYTWDDRLHSGFWWLGNIFREMGAKLASLERPTAEGLKNVSVYIIVDPDTPKETAKPNYMTPQDVAVISKWVHNGGVLLLMANDSANAELPRFNQLAAAFGMKFLDTKVNIVQGEQWEQGEVQMGPEARSIFPATRSVYIKELAPLALSGPARPVLKKGDQVVMATARVGKGTVLAVGDPWLYNEYTDGRLLRGRFENFQAGKELARFLLGQSQKK